MTLVHMVETLGEAQTATLFGLITGLLFGVAAQRSRFCLRAATVSFARGQWDDRVAVWLLTFSTAVIWVQIADIAGFLHAEDARIMAVPGSWSGAILGGLMFGAGMVLARGCSGRLLVLAATGNLRALVSGLIFAVVAQMALSGVLSKPRDFLAQIWITEGGRNLDALTALSLPPGSGLWLGFLSAGIALILSYRNKIGLQRLFFASGVGFSVAVGWGLTHALSQVSFDPVQIESATFTGPSAHTLMFFLERNTVLEFDIGLVPGVFLGAFLAAVVNREFRFEGYQGVAPMRRAILGAALMGFGGMLAGGCAIGAGVTGGSIFAATALCALLFMWIGAILTDLLFDQQPDDCPQTATQ